MNTDVIEKIFQMMEKFTQQIVNMKEINNLKWKNINIKWTMKMTMKWNDHDKEHNVNNNENLYNNEDNDKLNIEKHDKDNENEIIWPYPDCKGPSDWSLFMSAVCFYRSGNILLSLLLGIHNITWHMGGTHTAPCYPRAVSSQCL